MPTPNPNPRKRSFFGRAAEAIEALNPILFVLAIGLGVFDLTMYLAEAAKNLPVTTIQAP